MITPTVGRKVWYRPSERDRGDPSKTSIYEPMATNEDEPLDATVVAVWNDRLVNLAIFDIQGRLHARRSVMLLQDDDTVPKCGGYAEWMPYQQGQARAASAIPVVGGIPGSAL